MYARRGLLYCTTYAYAREEIKMTTGITGAIHARADAADADADGRRATPLPNPNVDLDGGQETRKERRVALLWPPCTCIAVTDVVKKRFSRAATGQLVVCC